MSRSYSAGPSGRPGPGGRSRIRSASRPSVSGRSTLADAFRQA